MTDTLLWIWLQQRLGYASRYAADVLRLPGGARFVYERTEAELYSLNIFPRRLIEKLCDRDLSAAEGIYEECADRGYNIITPDSPVYPERLKSIYNPPLVLYTCGFMPDVDDEVTVAIVGTRSASQRGLAVARELGERLCRAGAVVVSGCAVGIDKAAQEGAIAANGITIGVLGCGLDSSYNVQSRELRKLVKLHGALVSEYAPGEPARAERFPQRNRIISGLSLGVAVVEAGKKSGSSITAELAVEQGRDLFAVPGPVGTENAEGVNRMIADGAKTLIAPSDILSEYKKDYMHKLHLEGTANPLLSGGLTELSAERVEHRPVGRAKRRVSAELDACGEQLSMHNEVSDSMLHNAEKSAPEDEARIYELSTEARRIYDLMKDEPEPIDELAARVNIPPYKLAAFLLELEMNRAAQAHPGGRYSRMRKKGE